MLVTATNIANKNKVAVANGIANGKRGGVSVNAPITISDILNCNTVEVANNILNGLAAELKCAVADLGITVKDIIGAVTKGAVEELLRKLHLILSKRGDDLLDVDAPSKRTFSSPLRLVIKSDCLQSLLRTSSTGT